MTNDFALGKFSLGVGDRFGREAAAQLQACLLASQRGVEVLPVWNKSHREHQIIGSQPQAVRAAADAAVRDLRWKLPYYVDADHVRIETVDPFIDSCDFYTIDVADCIGQPATPDNVARFVERHADLLDKTSIPNLSRPVALSRGGLEQIARKYLLAVEEAGRVFRHIAARRDARPFITEVSMDETNSPQTPSELLVILAALADERIPVQTIAPKFTGRFNKGVDFSGDIARFDSEFNDDLAVVAFAIGQFGLPKNLKLSVHSGSDKFSLYPIIQRAIQRHHAGLHLKTAGATWLEELLSLASVGGEGLAMAKSIYAQAHQHSDALCAPYASVIDIDRAQLPAPETVSRWSSAQYVAALRHDARNPAFNPHFRQLLHVGYKIAANIGAPYLNLLETYRAEISRNVTENLFERHIRPLFLDGPGQK